MIFHAPTQTAIFVPYRCGSGSLVKMLCGIPGFWYCTGPAAWNARQLTNHVQDGVFDTIHDHLIRRRVLLVREPVSRTCSVIQHRISQGTISNTAEWFRLLEEKSGCDWLTQRSFCRSSDDVIRLEYMAFDVQRIFEISTVQRHEHKSLIEPPPLTPQQIDIVQNVFAEDFEMYDQQSFRLATLTPHN
jgi:hypothetical protein